MGLWGEWMGSFPEPSCPELGSWRGLGLGVLVRRLEGQCTPHTTTLRPSPSSGARQHARLLLRMRMPYFFATHIAGERQVEVRHAHLPAQRQHQPRVPRRRAQGAGRHQGGALLTSPPPPPDPPTLSNPRKSTAWPCGLVGGRAWRKRPLMRRGAGVVACTLGGLGSLPLTPYPLH
jgi:hypothetical protein